MSIDIFKRGGVPDADTTERAQRAVKAFRGLQPTLSAYARVLTGDPKVRVEMAARDNGSTDGHRIFMRPPIELGDRTEHVRALCDKRDESLQLYCQACAVREHVLTTIYHEIAHIAYGTFVEIPEKDKRDAILKAIKETGGRRAEAITERIIKAPSSVMTSYIALASYINEFMPTLVNCIEDARVNAKMFEARRGTKKMFDADVWRVFNDGVEQKDAGGNIVYIPWYQYPMNAQAMVGVFCKASGYKYSTWFHADVVAALDDEQITTLLTELPAIEEAGEVYYLSGRVMNRLRELGFLGTPEDPDPEPDPTPEENESDTDQDEVPQPDGEDGDSSDDGGEPPSGDEEGDGSSGDGDSADAPAGRPEDESPSSTGGGQDGESSDASDNGDEDSQGESAEAASGGNAPEADGEEHPDDVLDDGAGGSDAGDGVQDVPNDNQDGDREGGGEAVDETHDQDQAEASGDEGESSSDGAEGDALPDKEERGDADQDASATEAGDPTDTGEAGEDSREGSPVDEIDSDSDDAEGDDESVQGDPSEQGDGDDQGSPSSGTDGDGADEGGSDADDPSGSREAGEGDDSSSPGGVPEGDGTEGGTDPGSEPGTGDGDAVSGRDVDDGSVDAGAGDDAPDHVGEEAGHDSDAVDRQEAEGSVDDSSDQQEQRPVPERESPVDDRGGSQEGESELIDTGEDDGYGGTELVGDPEPEPRPEMGTPEECEFAVLKWGDHEEKPKTASEKAAEDAMDRAIIQGIYFTTPSNNVYGVREHTFDKHVIVKGVDCAEGWTHNFWANYQKTGVGADVHVDDAILTQALTRMRVAFSDNKRAHELRHRKSGKIDARVLGKRAPLADPRLFKKRVLPGKRDYFVLIGIDISGSTVGTNLALAKKAAMAQAVLCHRLGVQFALYAHSGDVHDPRDTWGSGIDMDIYIIKGPKEAWSPKAQEALVSLGPHSVNLDGHTIEYYRKILDSVVATDKILMYYTDGKMPAENHNEELDILRREIKICEQKGYTLMGVGIRTDSPRAHGLDTVEVREDEDIVKVVKHLEKRLAE